MFELITTLTAVLPMNIDVTPNDSGLPGIGQLRVIVGADKLSDQESEGLSRDIAKKIQDEMTYPGQVKITVIRETRAVAYAK